MRFPFAGRSSTTAIWFGGLSESALSGLLWGYLAASLAAVVAFASPRFAWLGYWILVRAALLSRLLSSSMITGCGSTNTTCSTGRCSRFCLFPVSASPSGTFVVLFYFWAGIIKLNPEWISGAALYGESLLLIPDSLIPAACIYVVVLELLLIFGLLSNRASWFWATLAQLGDVPPDFLEYRRLLLPVTDGVHPEHLRAPSATSGRLRNESSSGAPSRTRGRRPLRSACCWAGSSAFSSFRTLIRETPRLPARGVFSRCTCSTRRSSARPSP